MNIALNVIVNIILRAANYIKLVYSAEQNN